MESHDFQKQEKPEERMEEEIANQSHSISISIPTAKLYFELQFAKCLLGTFIFIPLDHLSANIPEKLKTLKEKIASGQAILDRVLQGQTDPEKKISSQDGLYIITELVKVLFPFYQKNRKNLFAELLKKIKDLLSSENFDKHTKCLMNMKSNFDKIISQNSTQEKMQNCDALLKDVFIELQKDLLFSFFGTQYQQALALIEETLFLLNWQEQLKQRIKELPNDKGYHFAKIVKELLYNTKTNFRKNFYQNITTEIIQNQLLQKILHNSAQSPNEHIQTLIEEMNNLTNEVTHVENSLKNYSYTAAITSALVRLLTNTQYYTFGKLAYDSSSELVNSAMKHSETGQNISAGIDHLERNLSNTLLGKIIDTLLQHLDTTLSHIDPRSFLALLLFGIDQCSVKWLGSTNFMLAHSVSDTLTADIEPLIQLGHRFHIPTHTIINQIEPKTRMALNFLIFMGITFGKDLLNSNKKIPKSLITFVACSYILSMLLRTWINHQIERAVHVLPEEQRNKTPHLFILIAFIFQFLSGLAIGFITNKMLQPLFFKPVNFTPEEQVCLKDPDKCKQEALKTLGLFHLRYSPWEDIKKTARQVVGDVHPDKTQTDTTVKSSNANSAYAMLSFLKAHRPKVYTEQPNLDEMALVPYQHL